MKLEKRIRVQKALPIHCYRASGRQPYWSIH